MRKCLASLAICAASFSVEATGLSFRSSQLVLRMGHVPLGRFDTRAQNALEGDVTRAPDGSLSAQRIGFEVGRLKSLITLRDEHLKNRSLEATKHPKVYLHSFRSQKARAGDYVPFTAELEVRGKRAPVQGEVRSSAKAPYRFEARLKSKVSTFGIPTPTYRGVGVDDEFEILVDGELVEAVGKPKPPTVDPFKDGGR